MGADADRRRGPGGELLVEAHGRVRLVTLNRPDALNATNEALHGELARIWPELDADPEVGAIVLTGAGKAFSGGGDLNLLDRMTTNIECREGMLAEAADIVRGMTSVRVPIVGAVESMLHDAMTAESASFDEPAFQANLARMLRRSASS